MRVRPAHFATRTLLATLLAGGCAVGVLEESELAQEQINADPVDQNDVVSVVEPRADVDLPEREVLEICGNGIDEDGDGVDGFPNLPEPEVENYRFSNATKVRDFINGLKRFNHIPTRWENAGLVSHGDATAKKVCELKGFPKVVSKGHKKFSSCGDNHVAVWNQKKNNFDIRSACSSNSLLDGLTCQRLVGPCNDGIDNDGDGAIDLAEDADCTSPTDLERRHDPSCDR